MRCICGGETRRDGEVDFCSRCKIGLPATEKGLRARRIVQEQVSKGLSLSAAVSAGLQDYFGTVKHNDGSA